MVDITYTQKKEHASPSLTGILHCLQAMASGSIQLPAASQQAQDSPQCQGFLC
jgi:hypothetical protein